MKPRAPTHSRNRNGSRFRRSRTPERSGIGQSVMLMPMPPRVRVEVLSAQAESQPGRWRVSFKVDNLGDTPLALQSAWIPHGRFRGDGRLPLACQLAPGDSTRLEFGVTAQEPPGTRLDNAYLILQAASAGRGWRIFTRMRIEFDPR